MTAIKTRTTWIVSVFLLLTLFAGLVMPAAGQDVLAIYTDKPDYAPGETVTLTGTGWADGEPVHIRVNDDAFQTWMHEADVTAGADGRFEHQFSLPNWFVANYSVTASGPTSGVVTTTFTDLAIGTYDQCSNDDGDGYATGDTGCRWINGNLQSNNSIYFEGDATVQRVWLTDFAPGSSHTVTLKYGTTKGGKHAYDFLTTWDWSEDWIVEADRCQGITGCVGLGKSKLDIPQDPSAPDTKEEFDEYLSKGLPVEFGHSLSDLIGGQCAAGFIITDFYEDIMTDSPLAKYHPNFIATPR